MRPFSNFIHKDDFELVEIRSRAESQEALHGKKIPQTEIYEDDDDDDGRAAAERVLTRRSIHTGWTPFWLRLPTLLCFIAVFVVMLAALEVLFYFSVRNNGLSTTISHNHYLWTYGPTAVLVVVSACWRQLDYRAKQLTPWAEMAKGPTSVDKSLLLDYVAQINYLALIAAAKNRHYLVMLSVSGFILITLMTVFSTGLLHDKEVELTVHGTSLIATDAFDGNAFNSSSDTQAVYTVYGVHKFNLSYPAETTAQYAIQSFKSPDSPNATLIGNVDVFTADLDCETGDLTYQSGRDSDREITPLAQYYNVSVSTPSGCNIFNAELDAPDWMGSRNATGYYGRIQTANCTGHSGGDASRLLIIMGYSVRNGSTNYLTDSSNIVCKPTYKIQNATVTLSSSSNKHPRVEIAEDAPQRTLSHISAWDIADGIVNSVEDSGTLVPLEYQSRNSITLDAFFYLLTMQGENITMSEFLDQRVLEDRSRGVYTGLAAQYAKRNLMSEAEHSFDGSSVYDVRRLLVGELSLRLMQGILLTLIFITAVLCYTVPGGIVCRDPDSIAAITAILASSPRVARILQGSGACKLDTLRRILNEHKFLTAAYEIDGTRKFAIETTPNLDVAAPEKLVNIKKPLWEWWRPVAVTLWGMAAILVLPPVIIGLLEGLYRISVTHNGLVDVTGSDYLNYVWTYIPAWTMTIVATLYGMLDSAIRIFQPYHVLHVDPAAASDAIMENPLGMMTLHALWNAMRKRQFVVFAMSVCMLFAPMLTIAVSGLFTSANVKYSHTIGLETLDTFNSTADSQKGQTTDAVAGAITSLILTGNLSYPQWTYDELAFPKITTLPFTGSVNHTWAEDATTLKDVTLPAVRGTANCSAVPQSMYFNATTAGYDASSTQTVMVNISMPDGCGNMGTEDAMIYLSQSVTAPQNGYFGQVLDTSEEGCPTLFVFFGRVSPNKTESITTLKCYPYVQQLQANVTFTLPDYEIDDNYPPIADEATVKYFSNQTKSFLDTDLQSQDPSSSEELDSYFQAVVYGKDGVPAEELAKDDSALVAAVEHVYRLYMAQWYSTNQRIDVGGPNEPEAQTLNGVFVYPYRTRLQMSMISTRILQGILGLLFICAVLTFSTMDVRRVLTKEPTSLASVASLVAGSSLLSEKRHYIPAGAEWWSNKEMRQNGLFKNCLIAIGWWNVFGGKIHVKDGEEVNGRFGIDIISRESEERAM